MYLLSSHFTRKHIHANARACAPTHELVDTHIGLHAYVRARALTHTHTCARAHTHTNTHTHTHTQVRGRGNLVFPPPFLVTLFPREILWFMDNLWFDDLRAE